MKKNKINNENGLELLDKYIVKKFHIKYSVYSDYDDYYTSHLKYKSSYCSYYCDNYFHEYKQQMLSGDARVHPEISYLQKADGNMLLCSYSNFYKDNKYDNFIMIEKIYNSIKNKKLMEYFIDDIIKNKFYRFEDLIYFVLGVDKKYINYIFTLYNFNKKRKYLHPVNTNDLILFIDKIADKRLLNILFYDKKLDKTFSSAIIFKKILKYIPKKYYYHLTKKVIEAKEKQLTKLMLSKLSKKQIFKLLNENKDFKVTMVEKTK